MNGLEDWNVNPGYHGDAQEVEIFRLIGEGTRKSNILLKGDNSIFSDLCTFSQLLITFSQLRDQPFNLFFSATHYFHECYYTKRWPDGYVLLRMAKLLSHLVAVRITGRKEKRLDRQKRTILG